MVGTVTLGKGVVDYMHACMQLTTEDRKKGVDYRLVSRDRASEKEATID